MKKAKGRTRSFAQTVKQSALRLARLGATFGAVGATMAAFAVRGQLKAVDTLSKLSDQLSLSTEFLAGMDHAATITGVSVEGMHKALSIFVRRLGETTQGLGEARYGLKMLGISADSLIAAGPEEAFMRIAGAIGKVRGASMQAYAAYTMFGRQGQTLLNLFQQGRGGIESLRREAEKLGVTFSRFGGRQVERANDAMQRMKTAMTGVVRQVTIKLAPAIELISDKITSWFTSHDVAGSIVGVISTVVSGLFSAAKALGEALEPLRTVGERLTKWKDEKWRFGWPEGGAKGLKDMFWTEDISNAKLLRSPMQAKLDKAMKTFAADIGKFTSGVKLPQAPSTATAYKRSEYGILDRTRMSLAGMVNRVIDPQKAQQIYLAQETNRLLAAIYDGQGLQ